MALRIAIAVVIGGGAGLAIGLVSSKLGGQCPLMCNPYMSTAIGIFVALLIAGQSGSGAMPAAPNVKAPGSDEELRQLVEQTSGVLLVEFYTKNCPACRKQAPVIAALSERYAGRVTIAAVDAYKARATAAAAGITGVPTILVFRDGEIVDNPVVGARSEDELTGLIEKHLSAAASPAAAPSAEAAPGGNAQ